MQLTTPLNLITAVLLCTALFSGVAKANQTLPLAVNLQETGKIAKQHTIPVVIFYSAKWCHYCHILEQNIIDPLLTNTTIEDYAEFRKVSLSEADWNLTVFNGETMGMEAFAMQQKVQFTPTTIVYNGDGQIITKPILGLTLEEFYPANLEKAINDGLKALGNDKRLDIYKLMDAQP